MEDIYYYNLSEFYSENIPESESEYSPDNVDNSSIAEKYLLQKEWEDTEWLPSDFKR